MLTSHFATFAVICSISLLAGSASAQPQGPIRVLLDMHADSTANAQTAAQ